MAVSSPEMYTAPSRSVVLKIGRESRAGASSTSPVLALKHAIQMLAYYRLETGVRHAYLRATDR